MARLHRNNLPASLTIDNPHLLGLNHEGGKYQLVPKPKLTSSQLSQITILPQVQKEHVRVGDEQVCILCIQASEGIYLTQTATVCSQRTTTHLVIDYPISSPVSANTSEA